MRPLIGITGTRHVIATNSSSPVLLGVVSGDDYAQGVETAGGIPVVVPYVETPETACVLADKLDGLLLGGGEDVDPSLWGEQPHHGLGQIVPERDALEFTLIRRMMERRKPILGICRGMQILNVALGGTLYQDLPRDWRGTIQHQQRARRNHLSHGLCVDPHSKLYQLVGRRSEFLCNSFHHQAVKDLGTGFLASAWDGEGLVEAMEHSQHPFLVAVQWHPENLWRTYPEHHGLFQGLVAAASSGM